MIYNLVQELKTHFNKEKFFANMRMDDTTNSPIPDRCVIVKETGGSETPWFRFVRKTIQILSRDFDAPKARELAYSVYEYITSRFGFELPQATVNGKVYKKIQIHQMSCIQQPYCLGSDETGRTMFTQNFMIIYKED